MNISPLKNCHVHSADAVPRFQAETADGETWDSNALHATVQRYPRKEYCRLVRETLETMREREAQCKRDDARLADIYKQVRLLV